MLRHLKSLDGLNNLVTMDIKSMMEGFGIPSDIAQRTANKALRELHINYVYSQFLKEKLREAGLRMVSPQEMTLRRYLSK